MTEIQITLTFDDGALRSYTDKHLATLWHVAQANPAPHDDRAAGELAEHIGREIIRRWLGGVEPELWRHQGNHHYWSALTKLATYEPGGESGTPEWLGGHWVPKDASEGEQP